MQFPVDEVHFHGIFRHQVFRQVLGTVGGTVLAAGAAETHLKVGEAAGEETLHVRIDQGIDVVQEAEYLPVLLQELNYGGIQACQLLEPLVLSGIVHGPAIKYIPSPVPRRVLGNALLIGETVNGDG